MRSLALALGVALVAAPLPCSACSLCGPGSLKRNTLGQDFDEADIVLYGKIVASRLNESRDAPPGSGSSDFQVIKVLKGDAGGAKTIEAPTYIPVLDAKDP